ncbi:iron-containing alcohol dehydrogenase [Gemmobacter lanyuensis]
MIQTAASVDGFTDNFSVVLQNGVKRTALSRWPDAVLADVRTIAEAPAFLTAAGMGEMMSMFCAPGTGIWRLSWASTARSRRCCSNFSRSVATGSKIGHVACRAAILPLPKA